MKSGSRRAACCDERDRRPHPGSSSQIDPRAREDRRCRFPTQTSHPVYEGSSDLRPDTPEHDPLSPPSGRRQGLGPPGRRSGTRCGNSRAPRCPTSTLPRATGGRGRAQATCPSSRTATRRPTPCCWADRTTPLAWRRAPRLPPRPERRLRGRGGQPRSSYERRREGARGGNLVPPTAQPPRSTRLHRPCRSSRSNSPSCSERALVRVRDGDTEARPREHAGVRPAIAERDHVVARHTALGARAPERIVRDARRHHLDERIARERHGRPCRRTARGPCRAPPRGRPGQAREGASSSARSNRVRRTGVRVVGRGHRATSRCAS